MRELRKVKETRAWKMDSRRNELGKIKEQKRERTRNEHEDREISGEEQQTPKKGREWATRERRREGERRGWPLPP